MKIFFKKYLIGVSLFLVVLFIITTINSISNINIGKQSAAVVDILPADSAPATGYAWNDKVGWINFGATTTSNNGQVYVSNNKLYGYAWGENVGWISMNCENDSACGTSDYTVTQSNSDGVLTGYAWGENVGWINFAPAGGGVTMTTNTSGTNTLSGYAWGENIGWISFTGASPVYGVSTTWTKPLEVGGGIPYQNCSYTYSNWSPCVSNQQTRTFTSNYNTCANSHESLSRICTVATTTAPIATTTPVISISIYPVSTSLHVKDSTTFIATITGTTSDALWSIKEGSIAGTISPTGSLAGLFTASTTEGIFHVIAKIKNDPSKSASSTITVTKESVVLPVEVTIDPKKETISISQSILFKSYIANAKNKNVTWIVSEEGGGTINSSGLYTAPNRAGIFHIIVRPEADPSKSDIATINVKEETAETPTIIQPENPLPPVEINTDITAPNSNSSVLSFFNINTIFMDKLLVLGASVQNTISELQNIIESPVGSILAKTITAVGVIATGIAATGVFALNSTSLADIFLLPLRLWSLLLTALGLKKRNRPWGTVYDSITKQPIDPAYVTLKKIGDKEEAASITDLDGRYGFLVSPGKYLLTANKTNYTFPSKRIFGQTTDVLYNNLYFGNEINIDTAGAVINKNIPLDPINFDWNEFAKSQKKLMKFYSKREKFMRILTDWLFKIGFLVSVISLLLVTIPYNLIILILYVFLGLLRRFSPGQKALGSLIEKNGNPLSFAIIRVFSPDLNNMEITNKVANKIGRYFCLVPKGKYYVKVEKKNDDESYSEIFTSGIIEADNGIISKNFVI